MKISFVIAFLSCSSFFTVPFLNLQFIFRGPKSFPCCLILDGFFVMMEAIDKFDRNQVILNFPPCKSDTTMLNLNIGCSQEQDLPCCWFVFAYIFSKTQLKCTLLRFLKVYVSRFMRFKRETPFSRDYLNESLLISRGFVGAW